MQQDSRGSLSLIDFCCSLARRNGDAQSDLCFSSDAKIQSLMQGSVLRLIKWELSEQDKSNTDRS
jgi:hypothetical protein